MAYDLKAKISLMDNFSGPLRKAAGEAKSFSSVIEQASGRTRSLGSAMDHAATTISRVGSVARSAKSSLSEMGGGIKSLTSGLAGLAGAYLTVQGAQKAFAATVGAAAQTEFEKVSISALFNDKSKAATWFDYVEKRAKDSALFSMDDFLKTSKSYIPITKDINQLQKLTALTERLAASNPTQGMEGSAFAIREALSGDMQSLIDRFNIPRAMANQIKGKSGAEFNAALDQMLNKLGYTDKYLEDISNTGLAKYNQALEKMRFFFRDMGTAGLQDAKGALDEINRMFDSGALNGLKSMGSDLISSAMGSLKSGLTSLNAYFAELKNDPTWNALGTSDKVIRIMDDAVNSAVTWFNGPGGDKFLQTTGKAAEVAGKIGVAAAGGIITGFAGTLGSDPFGGALAGVVLGAMIPGGPMVKAIGALSAGITGLLIGAVNSAVDKAVAESYTYFNGKMIEFQKNLDKAKAGGYNTPGQTMTEYKPSIGQSIGNWFSGIRTSIRGYASGLDTVPYDNYPARLHRGERVLTREESQAYSNGGGGNVTVSIGNITVGSGSTRQQADEIVNYIVGGLREAVANG